jgi:sRNA-binding carbon storage regulator CsrA
VLILTRRPGQAIHIGDHVVLVVRHKLRSIVQIDLYAPTDATVMRDGVPLIGRVVRDGRCLHPLDMLTGERFRVGEASVVIGEPPEWMIFPRFAGRQVRIGIDAPRSVLILRD